jgi:membrane fusion protein, multidrug efflux system
MFGKEKMANQSGIGSRRRSRWWIGIAVLAVCAVVAGFAATRKPNDAPKKEPERTFEFAQTDIYTADKREMRRVTPISGALMPLNQATVKAKVAAEVHEVLVLEGQSVQAGQVLVRLDQTEARSRNDAQRAAVDDARAKLVLAQKNRDNNTALLRQNFISQNALDNTESGLQVAKAALDSAQAQMRITQQVLDDTMIKAPISGTVSKRFVQRGDKTAIDASVVQLADLTTMQVEAPVPATDIPNIHIGQQVDMRVDGFDARKFSGKVERINPVAEAGSRSITTYIRISNPGSELRGGMFAQGEITLERSQPVLTVPVAAVLQDGDRKYVFALEGGKIQRRDIDTGAVSAGEGLIEVKSGLLPGAQVVANRIDGLKNGVVASIKQAGATAAAPDAKMQQANAKPGA